MAYPVVRVLYFDRESNKWQYYINVFNNTINNYISEAYGNEAVKCVFVEKFRKYIDQLQKLQC